MDEQLRVGELIEGTIATLRENASAAGIFLLGMSGLGTLLEWGLTKALGGADPLVDLPGSVMALLGVGAGIGGIIVVIVTIIAQYLLWEAMLENGALVLRSREGRRYWAFVGLMILSALGTGVASLALIIPGLIVSARWAVAPAFLIHQRMGVMDAMRQSWFAVKGNTTPVVFTYLIGMFGVLALAGLVGAGSMVTMEDSMEPGFLAVLSNQLVSNLATVLQVGFGVHLFRRLAGNVDDIGAVFD